MANTIQILKDGQPVYPITDVSLVIGLEDAIKLPPVKVTTLPTASAETAGKMYYVGPDANDEYGRYITSAVNGSYEWIDLGDTSIPLPSIADNLTTDDSNMALSAKQGVVLDGKLSQLGQGEEQLVSSVANGLTKCLLKNSGNDVVIGATANTNYMVIFYPVVEGKTYKIHINETRAGRVWGWCDSYLSSAPSSNTNIGGQICPEEDAPGSGNVFEKIVTNSQGYPYLVLAYTSGSGGTTCKEIVDGYAVLSNKVQYKSSSEKETARKNIDAASTMDVLSLEQDIDAIKGVDKSDIYTATSSWKTTTFTLPMRGGRNVKLTNISSTGYSTNSISIYYNSQEAATILYSGLALSEFPYSFILPFDISALLIVDGGDSGNSPKQNWKLEYQNDVIGQLPKLENNMDSELYGSEKSLYYSVVGGVISGTAVVGSHVEFTANVYRAVYKVDVSGLIGKVKIKKVLGIGNGKDVVLCDENDIVLAIFSHVTATDIEQTIIVDLGEYPTAVYLYVDGSSTRVNGPNIYSFVEGVHDRISWIDTLPQKGALLLHFDGSISPNDLRLAIIEEYGFKVSWCISPSTFSNTGTFSGDWTTDEYRQLYWYLIEKGHDVGIYPATIKTTESEWDAWFDEALANLAQKSIYNITAIHCGKLVVNEGLIASAYKHNLHILRGGGTAADGDTYIYTDDNRLVPIKASNQELYILASGVIGSSVASQQSTKERLYNAIEQNKVYSLLSHGIGTGSTDISEEVFRSMMDIIESAVNDGLTMLNWREFYKVMNPIGGNSNDYLRLLKIAKHNP